MNMNPRAPAALALGGMALLAFALGGAGCYKPTELMLKVESDLVIPDEMDAVRIRLYGKGGAQVLKEYPLRAIDAEPPADPPAGLTTLPIVLGVIPNGHDEAFDIQISAIKAKQIVLQQLWRTKFKSHTPLLLPAFLGSDCLDVSCAGGETCLQGACVSSALDPSQLGTYEEP